MYLIIIIILIIIYFKKPLHEKFTSYYVDCGKPKDHTNLIEILDKNYKLEGSIHWDLFIPCNNNTENVKINNDNQIIFGLSNYLDLIDKEYIYENFKSIMPNSYLLPKNLDIFKDDFNPKKRYFVKKENLKFISNQPCVISKNTSIVQEILENPYIINGKKIDIDLLLLISCSYDKYIGYFYNDINVNYTKLEYNHFSLNLDKVIPDIFNKNYNLNLYPQKLKQTCIYNKKLIQNLKNILKFILENFNICKNNIHKSNQCLQLLKIKFFITNDLSLKLLDINLPENKELTTDLYLDILDIIKIKTKKNNNFIQI
tara:strand:+ start:2735 stop:3676 length:942 start_codon:yes stop_codon:yes gene_type:complete